MGSARCDSALLSGVITLCVLSSPPISVKLAFLQHALHDANAFGNKRIAHFIVLQGNFCIGRIEGDAFFQTEAAAERTCAEITNYELEAGNGEVANLHEALFDITAQIVGGNTVLFHQFSQRFQGARFEAHNFSNFSRSRMVSMHCQKPQCI